MIGTRAKPPVPAGIDAKLKAYLESLQESVENGEGRRGKPGDRWIRESDLVRMGIARYSKNAGGAGTGVLEPLFPIPDTSKPPVATGLEVTGLFTMILVRWDNANRAYRAHSLTEIWRATEDDRAKAVIVGQTIDSIFSDVNVVYGQDYYYWIRWVSENGEAGMWNGVEGTLGKLSEDPSDIVARLQGEITESHLYKKLNDRIDLIDEPKTGLVSKVIVLENKSETSATAISQLTSRVDQNNTTVEVLQSSVNGLSGQYTVKIDNNGFVTGFGLSSESVDGQPRSMFLVNADRFGISNPGANRISVSSLTRSGTTATLVARRPHGLIAGGVAVITGATPPAWNGTWRIASTPTESSLTFTVPSSLTGSAGGTKFLGTGSIPFIVDDGMVVIDTAAIKDASISSAKILNLGVEKLIGNIGEFVVANIGTGTITSAMIDVQIQSTVYVPNQQGWAVNKDGFAEFQNIRARGDIEATSIKADAANIVKTLNVAGGAVTSMLFAAGGSGLVAQKGSARGSPSLTVTAWNRKAVETAALPMPAGSSGVVINFGVFAFGSADDCQPYVDIFRNNTLIGSVTGSYHRYGTWISSTLFDSSPALNNVYTMMVSSGRNGNGNGDREFNFADATITLTGGKR